MRYPSRWWGAKWRELMPAGNGKIGIGVYGEIRNETVMITHTDLWWKAVNIPMPDVSDKIKEVRRELLAGNAEKADMIIHNAFKERGYDPHVAYPLPLCDFKIHMPTETGFRDYGRYLDMESGEITVAWRDNEKQYKRKTFVSRKDDLIVYEIEELQNMVFDAMFAFDYHDTEDAKKYTSNIKAYLPQNPEWISDKEFVGFSVQNDDESDYGVVARVIAPNARLKNVGGKVQVEGANKITVLIKVFIKGNRKKDTEQLIRDLSQIEMSYDTLLMRHMELHKELFFRTEFHLQEESVNTSNEELLLDAYRGEASAELIEKLWSFGRYLLISASTEGGNPCNLYGLWCGEYQGYWIYNMFNENVQMIYWHAFSGNMPELLLPVFEYLEKYIDDFRENAKKIFGCRGIFLPAPTTPDSGLLKTIYPHIIHWTAGAGWIAQFYYKYYLFTLDENFLKNRAIPFMKEVALFYEDFFIEDESGKYISIPSISPENTPGNYICEVNPQYVMETSINATMDFAIAKELLQNLVSACEVIGGYEKDVEKWKVMLAKIPEYQINEDGAIKEWMHDSFKDNYHHRHLSHIYPIFPGNEITKEKSPELYKAFLTAIDKRLVVGLNEQSGWSLMHMANCYARTEQGDRALDCIDYLTRSCVLSNFLTVHNDISHMGIGMEHLWSPIQIDANMGLVAAVNEMLVQCFEDKIYILPALPSRWKKGSIKNVLVNKGILVSVEWDMHAKMVSVLLTAQCKDCYVNIECPLISYFSNNKCNSNSKKQRLHLRQGETKEWLISCEKNI